MAADEFELTTVADDTVVLHLGEQTFHRSTVSSPRPTTSSTVSPYARSPRPTGDLLCRFATVNDVHFGEAECGPDRRPPERADPAFRAG